jgi:hypothetical protein
MAETANVAHMAERLSSEIFATFGWEQVGSPNQNFDCLYKEEHFPDAGTKTDGSAKSKTHPADVVFRYPEPYASTRTYVQFDLKSYKCESIKKGAVRTDITNIGKAIECASISTEWRERYAETTSSPHVVGAYFLFNHDHKWTTSFPDLLEDVYDKKRHIAARQRVVAFGPEDINYLYSVARDIKSTHNAHIPQKARRWFFYPDRSLSLRDDPHPSAVTVETLLGPWIMLAHEKTTPQGGTYDITVYTRLHSTEQRDWLWLIDGIVSMKLIDEGRRIFVKTPFTTTGAKSAFSGAIRQYADLCDASDRLRARLNDAFAFCNMDLIKPVFAEDSLQAGS